MKPLSAIWQNSSFSKAILIAIICVSIIPILFVFIVSVNENNIALQDQMAENLRVLVEARTQELDKQLAHVESSLAEVAPLALASLADEQQLQLLLSSVQVSNPASEAVYVIRSDGSEVAADNGRSPTLPAQTVTAVPQWHTQPGSDDILTVSLLLDDTAVLAQDINLHTLTQSSFNTGLLSQAAHIVLYTPEGKLLGAGVDDVPESVPSLATAVISQTDDGTEQLHLAAPLTTMGWGVSITIPTEMLESPVSSSLRVRTLILMMAVVIFAIIVAAFLTQMIHAPLKLLLAGVEQLSSEGHAQPIAVDSFRELNHLAQAFNGMAATIRERENVLKAQVAHLRIEIDTSQKTQQVESLIETDFFKELEAKADRLRDELKREPDLTGL
jgi:methyl-accepting chemotaxis protein